MAKDIDRLSGQGRLVIVAGMQFGSEGKGAIASYLAPVMSLGVRTGAANAGHTIYFRGEKFIMRQIPSAWVNPDAKLVIGVGAMVSSTLLLEEIALVEQYLPIRNRLFIDAHAHVIQNEHVENEARSDLAKRIGSTSALSREGIGAATAAKVLRGASCVQVKDVPELGRYAADTVDLINTELDRGRYVLLEGTQGFGLSLEHGQFPFVTSRDTSVSALVASIGVNHADFSTDIIGVVRTFPIRVAGNSGPFDADSKEVSWEFVRHHARANEPIIECTSVTNKVRRVATFSHEGFRRACQVNRPTEIALTFADYLDWSVHETGRVTPRIETFTEIVEEIAGVPVTLVKTGPKTTVDLDPYRRNILRRLAR
ncbi:MAG: adenylosuccinate synthetase [bacterium]|nr:adenylosuccinate synthetase [bacterium]